MGPQMEPKSSSGAGGLRESLRERFGRLLEAQEAPQRLPRAPRERQESPRRVKMSPRRPKRTLRTPKMTPRRAKRSPRRAKVSSGRLPGAFWEGFPRHFQATRGDRDAPYSNRRRGRVAPEQGYRLALRLACFRSLPRDRARTFRKRRTRNSRLCLVVLCLASSRRCLCSSPRLLRRLRCLRLSLLTRFPFLDSQVIMTFWNIKICLGLLGASYGPN